MPALPVCKFRRCARGFGLRFQHVLEYYAGLRQMKSEIQSTSELAAELGLSRWTVSRALNRHPGIRRETGERVRAAAAARGFSPNPFARGLRGGRTHWVGVAMPDLVDYFLTDKVMRLQAALAREGHQAVFEVMDGTRDGERKVVEHFAAMRCAALVLIGSTLRADDAAIEALRKDGVPVVRVDATAGAGGLEVVTDRAAATFDAICRLHALRRRGVVVVGVDAKRPYGRQRIKGIKRACRLCEWDFDRQVRVVDPGVDDADDFAVGARAGREFSWGGEFDCVLAVNDRVAVGMIRALGERGVRVPEDVSVIGYDNADFGAHVRPALSTVDARVGELIEAAVRLLTRGADETERVVVRPRLIERESTRKKSKP